ncbi:hypothetical protein WJX72_012446 [[Myrmecia] bisecta]|uniref:Phospholipid/glycerol acyltransferase domain-containing protein n=1 Tax=[Myrmecia] bisecta TaxID=41462 RepID=A0AAW1PHB9_9CHLO
MDSFPISFLLYLPIGCILGLFRMGIWVAMLAADKAWLTDNDFMIKFLQGVLGVQVDWVGSERIPSQRHVLVSNHVTAGDLMILYRRPQHYVHLISTAIPQAVAEAKNHRVRLVHASPESYNALAERIHTDPVHLFPEGGMTNGKGMMKFSRGFLRFGKDLPIVPVALRCTAPWGLQTHTLTSSFLANLFWFCFLPWVRLEATVLEPCRMQEGEGKGAFAERVQHAIARELQVGICDLTLQQKRQLAKGIKPKSAAR